MNQIDEQQLERLKKRLRIDEMIAEKYGKSIVTVEKEFDPRLITILLEYVKQKAQQEVRQGDENE